MSISASRIVNVVPRAINAGASELEIVGLLLTPHEMCPFPATKVFTSAADVGGYFGLNSREYELAVLYFLGYTNSFKKPRKMVFGRLVTNAIKATMIGTGTVASLTTLQAITDGACVIKIDGAQKTLFHPDFSEANGYSAIAKVLNGLLGGGDEEPFSYKSTFQNFVLTSTTAGADSKIEIVADGGNVTVVKSYTLTTTAATTFEMRSKGLYNLGTETLVATWDQVWSSWNTEPEKYSQYFVEAENGELHQFTYYDKTGLLYGSDITCTEILSNIGLSSSSYWAGSNALTPSANMESIVALNQNWVSFTTRDEVSDEIKLALAEWCNGKDCEYLYCPYTTNVTDTDPTATSNLPNTLLEKDYEGGLLTYGSAEYAIFVMSQGACIDWDRNNGLSTYCFKQQSGLEATVEDNNTAEACESMNVNYYGNFATRNDEFVFYYEGKMYGGSFGFVDAYIGQLWLRNVIQVAVMNGLSQAGRVPYTEEGYSMIRAWCQDPINRALKNGAIEPGVSMSEAQKAQIISEVGTDVTGEIYLNGFYLLIQDPPAATRAARGTPTMGLWYGYSGSVHRVEIPTTVIM